MEEKTNPTRLDRSAFSVMTHEEARKQDIAFWHSRTPEERLEALENLRQTVYGYDPDIIHIEKVFEVVKREINNHD